MDSIPWDSINIFKKSKTPSQLKTYTLPALEARNNITKEKLKDLKEMVPYIPTENKVFYEHLINQSEA